MISTVTTDDKRWSIHKTEDCVDMTILNDGFVTAKTFRHIQQISYNTLHIPSQFSLLNALFTIWTNPIQSYHSILI